MALRGSQATRWAKKKSPHWAAIWPHVPYVCTDTPDRPSRTHSRPRLWDLASGAVLPPMGDSRPGLRPTPGPSRPRRGTESAHRCTNMHFWIGWGLGCSRPKYRMALRQTRLQIHRMIDARGLQRCPLYWVGPCRARYSQNTHPSWASEHSLCEMWRWPWTPSLRLCTLQRCPYAVPKGRAGVHAKWCVAGAVKKTRRKPDSSITRGMMHAMQHVRCSVVSTIGAYKHR